MKWMVALALLAPQENSGWKPLFNGKDLDGWEVWVGPGKDHPARGLNNDPDGVFTVGEIDGAPAMHITGQTIGAFTTKEEFDNFHFRIEFKWGEKTWGSRKGLPKDSGIFYFGVGPHGAGGGAWMKSVQANIMEEDYGSFWGVAGSIIDVELGDERSAYREDPKQHDYPVYRKGGKLTTRGPSGGDAVRPTPIPEPRAGSWNVAEVIAVNGTGIHRFNGHVTLVLRNARYKADGRFVPLTKGRIQLQSELAEIWYRKPEIRAIREFPAELRDWADGPGGDDGFASLLDDAHVKDWVQCGPGKFDMTDGVATGAGGPGLWWYKANVQELRPARRIPAGGGTSSSAFPIGKRPGGGDARGRIDLRSGSTWLPFKPPGEWNGYESPASGGPPTSASTATSSTGSSTTRTGRWKVRRSQTQPVRHRNVRIRAS
jgi:hypothetical protein